MCYYMRMETNELWKDVPGYEGIYQASNMGRIKTFYNKNGKEYLKQASKEDGYLHVTLVKNRKHWYALVHRIILLSFSTCPDKKRFVNHIDGNKHNNKLTNLEWVSASGNMRHSMYTLGNVVKPVIQISRDDKKIISEFASIVRASEITGISKVSISACLRNLIGSAGGYEWRFKNPVHAQRYRNRIFKYKYRVC